MIVPILNMNNELPFRLSVAKAHPIDPNADLLTRGHNKRQGPLQLLPLSSFCLR